jgi:predicted Zn-ribbon and HTH transcriptional regulator
LLETTTPIDASELFNVAGIPKGENARGFEEIVKIRNSLHGTYQILLVKCGKYTSCYLGVDFSEEWIVICAWCKTGWVSAPQFCVKNKAELPRRQ